MVQYKASNIILDIHSETSYLSDPKTHSSAGDTSFWKKWVKPMINDGSVQVIATIICHVMSSNSEAEVAVLSVNTKETTILRNTPKELVHPQPTKPLQTDNSIADNIVNGSMVQKRSKATDICFTWMRDQ